MKKLEENRDGDGKSLDYDGNDADGKCGADECGWELCMISY